MRDEHRALMFGQEQALKALAECAANKGKMNGKTLESVVNAQCAKMAAFGPEQFEDEIARADAADLFGPSSSHMVIELLVRFFAVGGKVQFIDPPEAS